MPDYVWAILIIVAVVVFAIWSLRNEEKKRVEEILTHQGEWGNEMCQWLIENKIKLNNPRAKSIMNNFHAWGQDTCKQLIKGTISVGMTVEMVTFSFGNPTDIDNREITEKDEKFRYVYGVPRQGATYIWFKNGKATKIKQ